MPLISQNHWKFWAPPADPFNKMGGTKEGRKSTARKKERYLPRIGSWRRHWWAWNIAWQITMISWSKRSDENKLSDHVSERNHGTFLISWAAVSLLPRTEYGSRPLYHHHFIIISITPIIVIVVGRSDASITISSQLIFSHTNTSWMVYTGLGKIWNKSGTAQHQEMKN